jgi:uncharacterized coiled-coil protein SlyX
MIGRSVTTQRKRFSELRDDLDGLSEQVRQGQTRVLLEEDGEVIGALISPDDLHRLETLEAMHADQWEAIQALDQSLATTDGVDTTQVARFVAANVRAELRVEELGGSIINE